MLPLSWSEKAAAVTSSRAAHTVLSASSPPRPCCLGRPERPTKASSRGHSQAAGLPLSCSHTPGSPRASAAKAPGVIVRKGEGAAALHAQRALGHALPHCHLIPCVHVCFHVHAAQQLVGLGSGVGSDVGSGLGSDVGSGVGSGVESGVGSGLGRGVGVGLDVGLGLGVGRALALVYRGARAGPQHVAHRASAPQGEFTAN